MKKTILAAACVLALSTAVASAQSSQGNVGPGTNQAGSIGNSGGSMNNSGTTTGAMSDKSGTTTGSGMSNTARNPSSQGNVGPGATPGNPGSSTNTK